MDIHFYIIHNEHNENNIAISPYGALSVLVALGEGLRGSAVHEIQHAAHIPGDISVIRVGLRDIHRHLKSYFIPKEGFLAGLTLNHENVSLNREYEDILKFYGYDVDSFNNALYPDPYTTEKPSFQTLPITTSTPEETTTPSPEKEGLDGMPESTTAAAANVLAFGDQPQNFNVISEDAATLSPPIFVPEDASESINEDYGSIPEYSLEDQIPPENLDVDGNTNFVTEENLSTEDNAITQAATDDISTMTLQTAAPPSNINTDNLNVEEDSRENFIAKDKRSAKFRSRNNRTSRSVVDYIIARYYDDHYIPPRPPSYIPEEHLTFLVHGKYREPNISFMKYDTVLPFHYIPHLNTLALSFPLDSTKYYLLLLLPVSERGVDQLICDLRMHGNLRYIIENLRYTHVVATIPSFTLKGYVNLTPTFQKLGIKKVFEPRQADFSPMTEQTEIYVTNIEQAVTVTIRNYVDPSTMNSHRNLHEFGIVQFKADHPFLYFVMDAEIHVTLMAGKIVNPLNARIR